MTRSEFKSVEKGAFVPPAHPVQYHVAAEQRDEGRETGIRQIYYLQGPLLPRSPSWNLQSCSFLPLSEVEARSFRPVGEGENGGPRKAFIVLDGKVLDRSVPS